MTAANQGGGNIAALRRYDFSWTGPSLDVIWSVFATRLKSAGLDAPPALTRDRRLEEVWRDPGLLLGQTCGYPYQRGLKDVVEIVATPVYVFDGCRGGDHCSFLIVREDDARRALSDFRGARAAINGYDSNTGMNLFRAAVAPHAVGGSFFTDVSVTGAHVATMAAISKGQADIGAVDCVTFGLVARHAPERLNRLRVLGRTPPAPALPFIVHRHLPERTRQLVREALFAVFDFAELSAHLDCLGLAGVRVPEPDAYERIDALAEGAAALGYSDLR